MSATLEDAPPPTAEIPVRHGRWIDDWRPNDPVFWSEKGAKVARRNLIFSIFSEHVGFCVWSLWSVLVLFMGPEYGVDAPGKFLLVTMPALVGAALRIPYTLAVAKIGGRNWTLISAALLLLPCTLLLIVFEP
nr:MFS transporter [Micromonospora sp. DSM 115978]